MRAACTTRGGGVSRAPFTSFNLAAHVGDHPAAVSRNRGQLMQALQLAVAPRWLNQVHGSEVIEAARITPQSTGDASYTERIDTVCAVLTADCLPALFCDRTGSVVAAAHAGWRGLAGGVLEATIAAIGAPSTELMVWLGPAIGPEAFEVGDEVRTAFVDTDAVAETAFRPSTAGRWMADIYALARRILQRQGITDIYGGDRCTYSESEHFYSYRRDGTTGRMAALIWLERG